jgi:hypothetical protein
VARILAVHGDVHRSTRLLEIGVEPFERHQNHRYFDLAGDQRRHIGRPAHERDHLRLDVELLEVAEIARDEIRQRRGDREHADFHLIGGPRGGRQTEQPRNDQRRCEGNSGKQPDACRLLSAPHVHNSIPSLQRSSLPDLIRQSMLRGTSAWATGSSPVATRKDKAINRPRRWWRTIPASSA